MLFLSHEDMNRVLDFSSLVDAVEKAFGAFGRGEAVMPPKVYLDLPHHGGDFRAMPGYVGGAAGLKWVNVHPNNPSSCGLPTVMAVMIYSDPETGRPLAVMDGTLLTRLRTAAAAAVATKYLARKDARSLGMIGCGVQARTHVEALAAVAPFAEIIVHDIDARKSEALAASLRQAGRAARAGSAREAAACDVICTTTPSREPVVLRPWVKPGAHINAMGADGPGKRELDPALVLASRIFVDDWAQASHSGEINVLVSESKLGPESVSGTLGEVVAGFNPGRMAAGEVTVFDSTGLAIQDVAAARCFYEAARRNGVGREFPFCEFER